MNNFSDVSNFSSKLWYNNRRISKNGDVSIYLQVVITGKHREFPVNLKWPATFVDLSAGVLLPRYKKDPDVNDYNIIIEIERGKHNEINRAYRIRKEPLDIKKFAREVVVFDNKECFTEYMRLEAERRFRKREIDLKTYQNANATLALIVKYDKTSLFKNINAKWMKGFRLFLVKEEYMGSTIWSRLAYTKGYLRLASAEPMIYVNEEAINFPNPKPSYNTTFVNKDELRRLLIVYKNGGLTAVERNVLRAFLFTCFTSLRISDVYRADYSWLVDDNFLEFIPHKGRKKQRHIKVPIMQIAFKFIKTFTGHFFILPSEAEYNRTLKDLARMANINKKLTSHVGRHTFGYLYMTNVGNLKGLQEIMGHKKIETTERYAHLDREYQQEAVMKIQGDFADLLMNVV